MSKKREQAIMRVYEFIKDLRKTLKIADTVKLAVMAKDYKVSAYVYKALENEGILLRKGSLKDYKLTWKGIEPTREMAIKVLNESNNLYNEAMAKRKAKKEQEKQPVDSYPEIDFMEREPEVEVKPVVKTEPTVVEREIFNGTRDEFVDEEVSPVEAKEEKAVVVKKRTFSLLWGAVKFDY